MSKGLDALNRVKQIEITESVLCGNGKIKQVFIEAQKHEDYKEDLEIIEKELNDYENLKLKHRSMQDAVLEDFKKLKALEIIKEKAVNIYYIEITNNYINYNRCIDEFFGNYEHRSIYYLTREEYNLLKEVML